MYSVSVCARCSTVLVRVRFAVGSRGYGVPITIFTRGLAVPIPSRNDVGTACPQGMGTPCPYLVGIFLTNMLLKKFCLRRGFLLFCFKFFSRFIYFFCFSVKKFLKKNFPTAG